MDAVTPWYWKKVNLFDDVDDDARNMFFKYSERCEYRKGDHIFLADDESRHVFFLRDGMIKIYHLSLEGEPTIFWFCVPGDLFGAGGICGSSHQSVFAQATEPSIVFAIPRQSFEHILKTYPQIGINVIRLLSGRLRLACDSMAELNGCKTDVRLARLLLRLAENCGQISHSGVELQAHITHEELANMIGASRQSVNEMLHHFHDHGWLEILGRRIVILAIERLQELVDSGGKLVIRHSRPAPQQGGAAKRQRTA